MASSLRDLQRLARGLSLVAKEALNGSPALEAAKSGELVTLISSSIKSAVVSATDLAGITKGRVREYSPPRPKETVVFFTDSPATSAAPAEPGRPELAVVATDPETRDSPNDFRSNGAGLEALSEKPDVGALESGSAGEIHLNVGEVTEEIVITQEESFKETGEINSNVEELSEKIVITQKESFRETSAGELSHVGEKLHGDSGSNVTPLKRRKPREKRVPSTPFTRALGFAGLGAGLAWGTIQESAKRLVYGTPPSTENQSAYSPFLSEQNAERLALALCRMRGAALKLGQMLSIQDESLVPAPILSALEIVRQGADVMPRSQLNEVLSAELGPEWTSKLMSFDYEPMAAASIGQVHKAVMRDGLKVAMKIQYPGVADSIESDIENVKRLLDYTNLIPKGLFLDRAIKVAKEELSRECDYKLEATNQKRFRELLSDTEGFYVPMVIDEISSRRVLTTELVTGIPIDKVATLNQETRDYVGKKLLQLTLEELFVFRFMQTDPNWSNFLYDEDAKMINLIDFGAARDFPQRFVHDYLRMVIACANCDRSAVIDMSQRLGFLTGMESDVMLDAHVQAAFIVGMPFSKPGGYDFRKSNITHSISTLGATMLKHRLTPPPDEAYSLHRKLSGAFLACIKLGAVVPCRQLLLQVYENYQFSNDGDVEVLASSTG